MQFTLEQYTSLLALIGAVMIFGFFSYHCGLRDRNNALKTARQNQTRIDNENLCLRSAITITEHRAATDANAIEALSDDLDSARNKAKRLTGELLKHINRVQQNDRTIELLNAELEAANLIKHQQLEAALQAEDIAEAYAALTGHLKNEITDLRRQILNDNQRKTIRQAAAQLLMTSQVMGAIKNKESASTQHTLAVRLQEMVSVPTEAAPEKEAA